MRNKENDNKKTMNIRIFCIILLLYSKSLFHFFNIFLMDIKDCEFLFLEQFMVCTNNLLKTYVTKN